MCGLIELGEVRLLVCFCFCFWEKRMDFSSILVTKLDVLGERALLVWCLGCSINGFQRLDAAVGHGSADGDEEYLRLVSRDVWIDPEQDW